MRYLYLLLLILPLCYSCKYKHEMPSNFYFKMDDGATDYYDSEKDLFYRTFLIESEFKDADSVLVKKNSISKKEFPLKLNEKDYKEIYDLYKKINFQDFPSTFEIDWDNSKMFLKTPSFEISLEICEGDICTKVVADIINIDNPIKDKRKGLKYVELYELIWKIIKEKEEYKMIPKSNILYD